MPTTPVDYNALAAQAGAINAPQPSKAQPAQPATSGAVDYAALARQAGAIDSATPAKSTQVSPEEQASQTRQMLVSGLTGMPTPNMTEQDRQEFEQGKAAGAISVPLVAGAVAAPEVINAMAQHMDAINKVWKIGKELGFTAWGLKEATDLYKSFFGGKATK